MIFAKKVKYYYEMYIYDKIEKYTKAYKYRIFCTLLQI
jgi:hypothetical protein